MAFPKKFPHLADAAPRLTVDGGTAYHPFRMDAPEGLTERRTGVLYRQAHTLAHPTPAGYYDPLSIMCVVDLLLRLEHDTIIRARDLAKLLTSEYPHFTWPGIVAGRIMSDLAEAALATGMAELPIAHAEDKRGHYFVVSTTPAAWEWLLGVRVAIGTLAEEQVALERTGHGSSRTGFPFDCLAGVAA